MFIQNLETKIKFSLIVACTAIIGSVVFSISISVICSRMVAESRKNIYLLDTNSTPLLASQSPLEANLETVGRAHVELFHSLFFTLPPDDEYINYTLEKAMYLIDESGLRQKNALQEKGFYSGILSQTANFSIMCDSVKVNTATMSFEYYGTQRIERKTSILKRQLITSGNLRIVPHTDNNPHGLIITDYKTLVNKDVDYQTKSSF